MLPGGGEEEEAGDKGRARFESGRESAANVLRSGTGREDTRHGSCIVMHVERTDWLV